MIHLAAPRSATRPPAARHSTCTSSATPPWIPTWLTAPTHPVSPISSVPCGVQPSPRLKLPTKDSGGMNSTLSSLVPMPTTKQPLRQQLLAIQDPTPLAERSMPPRMPWVRTPTWATSIIHSASPRAMTPRRAPPIATPRQLTIRAIPQQMAPTRVASSSTPMCFP